MKTITTLVGILALVAAVFFGWNWNKVQDDLSRIDTQNDSLKSEIAGLDTLLMTTVPVQYLIELASDQSSAPMSSKSAMPLAPVAQSDLSICPLCPCPTGIARDSSMCCCTFASVLFKGSEKVYLFDEEDAPIDPAPYMVGKNDWYTVFRPRGRNGRLELPRYIHYKYQGRNYEIRLGASPKAPVFEQFTVREMIRDGQ